MSCDKIVFGTRAFEKTTAIATAKSKTGYSLQLWLINTPEIWEAQMRLANSALF